MAEAYVNPPPQKKTGACCGYGDISTSTEPSISRLHVVTFERQRKRKEEEDEDEDEDEEEEEKRSCRPEPI